MSTLRGDFTTWGKRGYESTPAEVSQQRSRKLHFLEDPESSEDRNLYSIKNQSEDGTRARLVYLFGMPA
jgi:hypothetical protein